MFRALIFMALFSTTALADGGATSQSCHCDQYRALVPFASLSDQVAAVGVEAIHSEGHAFAHDDAIANATRLRIETNALIPEDCRKSLIAFANRPRGTLFARVSAGGSLPQSAPDQTTAFGLYGSYNFAYNKYLNSTWSAACGSTPTAACAKTAVTTAWNGFSAAMQANPQGVFTQAGLSTLAAGDVATLKAYHGVMTAGSEQAMLALVASKKDGLNNQQFMTLVQMVGARLAFNYDNARNAAGLSAPGVVTGDQLLAAAENNTMNGPLTNNALGAYAKSQREVAGVCRDIMTLQAKMLQARGFPNVYTLSYETSGSDYHTVAITTDPDHPTQLHSFSYMLRTDIEGSDGSVALFEKNSAATIGRTDRSTQYYLARPEGAMVAVVPSELSKFLVEASGFDIRDLDPLARATSSMIGAGETFSSASGGVTGGVRLVTGQDGVGANYVGGGGSLAWGQNSLAPGKIGLFVGAQAEPASAYGSSGDTHLGLISLTAQQHVLSPKFKPAQNTTIQVDTSGILSVTAGLPFDNGAGDAGKMMGGADLRLDSHVTVDRVSDNGKLHSTYVAGARVAPGVQDVRNMQLWSDPTVVLNGVYAGTQQTLRVQDWELYGKAMIAGDLVGVRGEAELGAASKKFAVGGFIAGRLPGSTALVEDNSLRRVGLRALYRPNKYLELGVTGQIPIEGDTPLSQANVMGTAIVNW